MDTRIRATRKAIRALGKTDAESAKALSERTGLTFHRWDMRNWRESGVPLRHALKLSTASGVPAHELAPDVYPESVVIAS